MASEHPAHESSPESASTRPQGATPPSVASDAALVLALPTLPRILSSPHIRGRGNHPVQQASLLQLQRMYGNRAVQRLLAIQRMRLEPGGPADAAPPTEEEVRNAPAQTIALPRRVLDVLVALKGPKSPPMKNPHPMENPDLAKIKAQLAKWQAFLTKHNDAYQDVLGHLPRVTDTDDRNKLDQILKSKYVTQGLDLDATPTNLDKYSVLLDEQNEAQAMATSELRSERGVWYLYIPHLAAAPWHVLPAEPEKRRADSGREMVKQLIRRSLGTEAKGRLRLNAAPSAVGFYKRLGFEEVQPSGHYELSPEKANELLKEPAKRPGDGPDLPLAKERRVGND